MRVLLWPGFQELEQISHFIDADQLSGTRAYSHNRCNRNMGAHCLKPMSNLVSSLAR
jgi:hypothetical protein